MITTTAHRNLLWVLSFSAACLAGTARSAEPDAKTLVLDVSGGWQASFDSRASVLECRHPASGTVVAGRLSFTADFKGKRSVWSIQPPRDKVARRLVLVDDRNDVQGYVVVNGDLLRLSLTAVHRPPHRYPGELTFAADIRFGTQTFACRTRVSSDSPVVQMASGPADSLLNDSLFDAGRDMLLRLSGKQTTLATAKSSPGEEMKFQAVVSAEASRSDGSTMTLEIVPDYYRSRYVPYYHLIDRKRCPKAPTGWMAWNIYFDAATEDDNLAEARVGARYLKPFGLEFWSIESWQENSPRLPVSKFSNLTMRASAEEFPHGMKWLADQIRALGFRPGIWTVSFGTGDENFYKSHREWFLHGPRGPADEELERPVCARSVAGGSAAVY